MPDFAKISPLVQTLSGGHTGTQRAALWTLPLYLFRERK